jgi:hypothetical protein
VKKGGGKFLVLVLVFDQRVLDETEVCDLAGLQGVSKI